MHNACIYLQTISWYIHVHVYGFLPEEEVDGETLLSLTEDMVRTLLPTMKKQVILLKGIKELEEKWVVIFLWFRISHIFKTTLKNAYVIITWHWQARAYFNNIKNSKHIDSEIYQ